MKELKVSKEMFTKNALGEYWQARCMICLDDVFAFSVNDVHCIYEDDLRALIGRPICKGCFEELKDKIPEKIDLIEKREMEKIKAFVNIEKTHQAPRCKKCGLAFPRLNQKTMICDSCERAKKMDKKINLDKWI